MKRAIICPDKCKNCLVCAVAERCTFGAVIREEAGDKPWIDFYRCAGCMKCMNYCQHKAAQESSKPCEKSEKQNK